MTDLADTAGRMAVPFVHGPNDLRVEAIARPAAGPRDVVLRVAATGICGTDLGFLRAGGIHGPTDEPFPLGHELAGTVAELGAEVTSVAVGDRVILDPLANRIGNGGPEGGFAERLLVRGVADRPDMLLPIPPAIDFEDAALIEPLAVAAHAVNQSGARAGDRVAIFGAGPIGLAATIVLRHRGFGDVVVFDPSAFRRERAVALGAAAAFDPLADDPARALIAAHGGVRVFAAERPATTHYIEAAGTPQVLPAIVAVARAGASICVAAVPKKPIAIDVARIVTHELRIVGTLGYPTELREAIAMVGDGIDLSPMVSHRFAAEDVLDAFATAARPELSAKVLVRYAE